jgi:phage terminase large subunit GpA-like protein
MKDDLFLGLKPPKQCKLWKDPNMNGFKFERVETYVESSHFDRGLLKCPECGQLYYYEFYEVIDWKEGNDQMYSTYIPIEYDKALIEDLNKRSPLELLAITPRLQWDPDGSIKWIK